MLTVLVKTSELFQSLSHQMSSVVANSCIGVLERSL